MGCQPLTNLPFFDAIKPQLDQVEELIRHQAKGGQSDLQAAFSHLISAGGKRVRPAVTILTGMMLDCDMAKLITLAGSIELLHTATLVHDDLIDGALLRRGNSTINSEWSPAATVLTGDYMFAKAANLAANTESVTAIKLFASALGTIVNGEITQLFSSKGVVSRENYYERIYAKTASMFELSTSSAASLSNVSEELYEEARKFGHEMGMAFQIVDDILDFTGKQNAIGKPVASDLRQGLITLPAIYYHEKYPEDPIMAKLIHRTGYSEKEFEELIANIISSEAIDLAYKEASQYVENALEALDSFPKSQEHQHLENIARYIINREK